MQPIPIGRTKQHCTGNRFHVSRCCSFGWSLSADITTAEQQCGKSKNNIAPVPKETGLKSVAHWLIVAGCRHNNSGTSWEFRSVWFWAVSTGSDTWTDEKMWHILLGCDKIAMADDLQKTEQALTWDLSDFDQSVLWECCNSVTYEQTWQHTECEFKVNVTHCDDICEN